MTEKDQVTCYCKGCAKREIEIARLKAEKAEILKNIIKLEKHIKLRVENQTSLSIYNKLLELFSGVLEYKKESKHANQNK